MGICRSLVHPRKGPVGRPTSVFCLLFPASCSPDIHFLLTCLPDNLSSLCGPLWPFQHVEPPLGAVSQKTLHRLILIPWQAFGIIPMVDRRYFPPSSLPPSSLRPTLFYRNPSPGRFASVVLWTPYAECSIQHPYPLPAIRYTACSPDIHFLFT